MDQRWATITRQPLKQSPSSPPPYEPEIIPKGWWNNEPETIPAGSWDLACTISPDDRCLTLDGKGAAVWRETLKNANAISKGHYQWNGFDVDVTADPVKVTIQSYAWLCDRGSEAGALLLLRPGDLTLEHFGEHLAIFRLAIEPPPDFSRPQPEPCEDEKGSLQIEAQVKKGRPGIYYFAGTDIYQVQGDEKDIVIRTRRYLRLWDIKKGKLRWEKFSGCAQLCCLTTNYVLSRAGKYELRQRHNGYVYGDFYFPSYSAFISLNKADHFGPVRSRNDLVLYKPCKTGLYLFEIGADDVKLQTWGSDAEIHGSLVLRGNLQNVHLQILGQCPEWNINETRVSIYKNWNPIMKYVLDM